LIINKKSVKERNLPVSEEESLGVLKVHRVPKVHRVVEDGGDDNFLWYKTSAHCC